MPKVKRMRNNASSAATENAIVDMLVKESENEAKQQASGLIAKHSQLRTSYLGTGIHGAVVSGHAAGSTDGDHAPSQQQQQPQSHSDAVPVLRRDFTVNRDMLKLLLRSSLPARFPQRMDHASPAPLLSSLGDSGSSSEGNNAQELAPMPTVDSRMTKSFLKFWNKLITRQDVSTSSVLEHQLTEKEAGFYGCQLGTLLASPNSYLRKPFCQRGVRYSGPGHQMLPASNSFTKVSSRSMLRLEVNRIMQHYTEPTNQYFLIPCEFSSRLSRSLLRSVELCQRSGGCNKLLFSCQQQQGEAGTDELGSDYRHPILTVPYKTSIEQETLPAASLSLVDNCPPLSIVALTTSTAAGCSSSTLLNTIFNYPYLNHMLHRADFWVDDMFAKFWHYSRYFCDRLVLAARTNSAVALSVKDALFKFLLAAAARLCLALKCWVLDPEGASYFRCWCGHNIYNEPRQEAKMVAKFGVGSSQLFSFQYRIRDQEVFHRRHSERKHNRHHICSCGSTFKDHQGWMNHALSPKVSDLDKICPVVVYNVTRSSLQENRFQCECKIEFCDYDFWSFWLHLCNCKVFKAALKNQCSFCQKAPRHNRSGSAGGRGSPTVSISSSQRTISRKRARASKRTRTTRNYESDSDNESECKTHDKPESRKEATGDSGSPSSDLETVDDDACYQSGDSVAASYAKTPKQRNSNHCRVKTKSKVARKRKRRN